MDFLNGNYGPILKMLESGCWMPQERMEYEEAATWRDLKNSVSQIAQKQKITSSDGEGQRCDRRENGRQRRSSPVFFIRQGRLIGRGPFLPADRTARFAEYRDFQFYEAVLFRHAVYSKGDHDPGEIEDQSVLEEWLGKRKGRRCTSNSPKKVPGEKTG